MPAIPANFFTRTEIQKLILKTLHVQEQTTCPEQSEALGKVRDALCQLEGVLADIAVTSHPNDKALANPNGWENCWMNGDIVAGQFNIGYSRQLLRIPGHRERLLPTGRYGVRFGGATHVLADRAKLDALLVRHVEMSEPTKEDADALFNLLRMAANAVQEPGPAA